MQQECSRVYSPTRVRAKKAARKSDGSGRVWFKDEDKQTQCVLWFDSSTAHDKNAPVWQIYCCYLFRTGICVASRVEQAPGGPLEESPTQTPPPISVHQGHAQHARASPAAGVHSSSLADSPVHFSRRDHLRNTTQQHLPTHPPTEYSWTWRGGRPAPVRRCGVFCKESPGRSSPKAGKEHQTKTAGPTQNVTSGGGGLGYRATGWGGVTKVVMRSRGRLPCVVVMRHGTSFLPATAVF